MTSASRALVRAALVTCFGVLCLLVVPSAAQAHDSLKSSSPAKNAVVTDLKQIELEYSAHVSFPVVIVHDAAGRRYDTGEPRTDGPNVFKNVAPLPNGSYVIAWRVVSSDGHPIQGEIPFTVAGSAVTAPPVAVAATSGAAGQPQEEGQGIPGWIWAIAIVLVALGVAALLGVRTRRTTTDPTDPAEPTDPTDPTEPTEPAGHSSD
ncbi:copper resistance protein CopC [Streptosporangiaceae bacterium NEAU-GS5]|nr:copper resistance protein CopC [Streptosporangiaceae bacterium NEAU-GS5]